MAWFYLIIGGLFEIGFTTSLRFVDGFRNLPWTLAFLVSVGISMAGTVMVGMIWFDEPATTIRLLLILAIVAAIAALRLTA